MEDYEEDLYGVEDDFHNQFAAELEVLAELEGGCGSWVAAGSWLHPASVMSCMDGIGSGWEFASCLQCAAAVNLCLSRDTGRGAL